ncbi:hypothetical protein COCCADRAFT_81989 [Bipolaris zeicola 26-R-13]|uniref:DUF8004 domain-containing protein n=1 Tax=Cochliobolus carbonum (strain 26-R-13) TaxID=930089 RepID=W6YMS6_COCC2|nr:uncharacterized protein COCCADRAFT_81989 [Bipolaris zeicola 26-R-13]EUC38788.1 hypothetical protein COCCADRAFT_81989 [Bipolaris zeicola 26-R-13]
MGSRSASCSAAIREPMHPTKIQRWSGLTRTVNDWDHGLRRDPELWYEDGDCYVHLHARGMSRRGPSFCIPFRVLRQKKCESVINQCDAHLISLQTSASQKLKRVPSSLIDANKQPSTMELFIPAPAEVARQDSFRWHITTRNFFAFLLGKPLVGDHMGQAYVDLQERLDLFRPDHPNNVQDFLSYAEDQGYRDLVECTDYALASLFYAERYKLRDVWVDAFAHCVGMNESLALSPEFSPISKLTKALITRAHREVDAHLGRVSAALSKFLQEDFSPTYLGLTDAARSHLDRFRRFLHTFYAEKFGYWPPPRGTIFPKALYKSMYYDFKSLYDYLVDTTSTVDISSQGPASGGICVLQNVLTFDQRHNFTSLPHPLPLLPTYISPSKKSDSHRALRQLTLASQHQKTHKIHTMSGALRAATNILDQHVTSSKIVQAYMHFENAHAVNACRRQEKITVMDARKVRWLLIYGTLQYLVSALRAPKQVRDSESSDYPLCYIADPTSSAADCTDATPSPAPSVNISQAIDQYILESQCSPSPIEPDCQREDYFTPKNLSRRGSMEVSPLRVSRPARPSSVRSLSQMSLSSLSSRRNSLTTQSTRLCVSSTKVLNESVEKSQPSNNDPLVLVCSDQSTSPIVINRSGSETSWFRSRTPSVSRSRRASSRSTDGFPRTPLLDGSQLDRSAKALSLLGIGEIPSRSGSTSSTGSSMWSEGVSAASSESSTCDDKHKTSEAEESGLLGGLVSIMDPMDARRIMLPITPPVSQSHIHPSLRQESRGEGFRFELDDMKSGVKHGHHEPDDFQSTIGMAVSMPPSSSLHVSLGIEPTLTDIEAHPPVSDKRPSLPRSISILSAPDITSSASNGSLDTAKAPTGNYWEQYKATLTQQRERSRSGAGSRSEPASSGTFKVPFSRLSKPSNEDNRGVKSERRLSHLWRR